MKRVVTGHDAQGRSVFAIEDEPQPIVLERPADCASPSCGPRPASRARGASSPIRAAPYFASSEKRRRPGMHRTRTIDYAIVLSGEIYAVLDEGEVLLKAGDVLIQRATNHAWSNRGDRPCRIAFVLVDAA